MRWVEQSVSPGDADGRLSEVWACADNIQTARLTERLGDVARQCPVCVAASTTSDDYDAAQVAEALFGRTRTRRCPPSRPRRSRIRHKRSRTCCRSAERAEASAALGLRGDSVGRKGWSPQTHRSCREVA